MEPMLPMLRIEPVLPMLRMLPALPRHNTDPTLPMLRMDPALRMLPTLRKLMMLSGLRALSRPTPALRARCRRAAFRYAFLSNMSPSTTSPDGSLSSRLRPFRPNGLLYGGHYLAGEDLDLPLVVPG